jgi:poly(3-hydroxybutyrate) depolymerase
MKKYILLLLFLILTFAGINANPVKYTMTYGGYEREYMVYLPKSYDASKKSGLVICLHGFNGSMDTFFGNYDITSVADGLNMIIVAPQALPEQSPDVIKEAETLGNLIGKRFPLDAAWGCGLRVKSSNILFLKLDVELNKDIDDVGFIKAVTDKIKNDYPINRNIFILGTSLGGFMSYQYAMYHGDELSGLISICGSMGASIRNSNSDLKLPVCDFHSITDEVVPYNGTLNYKVFLVIDVKVTLCQDKNEVIKYWVNKNGTTPTPDIEQVKYYPPANSITVEKYTYASDVNPVIHYKIDGAYHEYYFRKTNGDCMDYNEEIVKFITACSKDKTNNLLITKELKIYPNPATGYINIGVAEGYATIYNITGEQVYSGNITSSRIDISSLSKGVFIVTVKSPEGYYQGKLIVR